MRWPARCCRAVNYAIAHSSGILEVCGTKNQLPEVAKFGFRASRIRRGLEDGQKVAGLLDRSCFPRCDAGQIALQMEFGERDCEQRAQRKACEHTKRRHPGNDCSASLFVLS